jgi:hypothetical protein
LKTEQRVRKEGLSRPSKIENFGSRQFQLSTSNTLWRV